jgi:hypothetical protein
MTSVVQPLIQPDLAVIAAHLQALFAPVLDDGCDGLIEIRHGPIDPALKRAAINHNAWFRLDQIDAAAAYAADCNARGHNVYVGVNPRKPDTDQAGHGSDTDVALAYWHFADLDDPAAVAAARSYLPLRYSMLVMTGAVPESRPHFYWRLEEACANLPAWTVRQRAIAAHLGGDAVINPSRIMRLAGTVNYPAPHKIERGYRTELTTLRTFFDDDTRGPFSFDMMAMAFPDAVARAEPLPADPPAGARAIDTGHIRVADLISAIRRGDQWHNHMVRLVAHMVSSGRTDAEIIGLAAGLTLDGHTTQDTVREMAKAMRGARAKWAIPEPDQRLPAIEPDPAEDIFELLDLDELEALPAPTWLIADLIADHGLSVLYGDPGAGKSFIAIDMALRLAFAMDWHGTPARAAGVLYIAGEGSRGLGKRVAGWRREHAMDGVEAPFLLLPAAVQLLDDASRSRLCRTIDAAKSRAGFPIGLVVIDTVSRAIAGADENGQETMSLFVKACAEIQAHCGGAVLAVHHSGKDKDRGMRGSTVLLGGCDASIRLTKDEGHVTLTVEKQKDAEQGEPVTFSMKQIEWASGVASPLSTLVPIRTERSPTFQMGVTADDIAEIFEAVDAAWLRNDPWSVAPQSRRNGRYLPAWISETYEVTEDFALELVSGWQMRGQMVTEAPLVAGRRTGLRLIKPSKGA